ncbi:MAG: UvrD-helicase domain-containing protein [Nitrospirae bacterium]|nr:UvrD-helicase domain-containing protein [Nitrospirota bacterium]
MAESYLDISKSVMISSPAGSGKTEKLARRYIELLKGGSDVERILAITFTDKAAAEMKERIMSILRKEDDELFERVREKMPRMRISTIHSFCLKLLKRFCLELGMDVNLDVTDSFNAGMLWGEAVYESLLEDGRSTEKLFYEVVRKGGIKGWNKLFSHLQSLYEKRPGIELGLGNLALEGANTDHFGKILAIYSKCLLHYRQKKRDRHLLDYNDLELLAYDAISNNPEWQNVLYSFDEHTDHILVDEFQDTSNLQWRIIDKLTEEWRSGMGAKRESGMSPTIFLVGDDKQSIYSFRGADAEIFRNAKNKFSEWLGEEYHYIEVKENYRSLPAIVRFVNELFIRLMPEGLYEDRNVSYVPFEATRSGEGRVELLVCESIGSTKDNRKAEAMLIAGQMEELNGSYELFTAQGKRKCCYGDMAVLLRNRTHLSAFEDALRKRGIPFVVVKGVGFYNTPEVGILKDLLFFLIDPLDDYSLFNILRSPLFSIDYASLMEMVKNYFTADTVVSGYLYKALESYKRPGKHKIEGEIAPALLLGKWIERARSIPYAILIEEVLSETGAWQYFHEMQRYVNVKKFIKIVEDSESLGLTGLEIRDKLIKAAAKSDESKANVNAEGMDAVRIMTTHAAKGLQFPMVFLPGLDDGVQSKSNSIIVEDSNGGLTIGYEEDSEARKNMRIFRQHKEKAEDEEKRLFYVSTTRAMDYLCMSGTLGKRLTGKLAYVYEAFNIFDRSDGAGLPFVMKNIGAPALLEIMAGPEKAARERTTQRSAPGKDELFYIEPLNRDYRPPKLWRNVTEEADEIRRKHGNDWVIIGRAFHRVFEGISRGLITKDNQEQKILEILRNEVLFDDSIDRMLSIIVTDLSRLETSGHISEIIMPRGNAYAELPFVLELGQSIYKGRIDRVIVRDGLAHIYDYKTYPVSEEDMKALYKQYAFQLNIYKKAAEQLFNVKAKGYLFFTHEQKIM